MTHALPTPCRLFGGLHKILSIHAITPQNQYCSVNYGHFMARYLSFATTAAVSSMFFFNEIPAIPDTY